MNEIEKITTDLLPDKTKRRVYLEILCEIISYADSFGSEKWGLSIKSDGIRVKIGNLITTTIHENSLWLALDKELIENNTSEIKRILESDWDSGEWAEYSAIKTRNYFYRDNSKEKWKKIKHLHFGTIKKASNKYFQLRTDSQKNTSFQLLEYLTKNISSNLPFPKYKETLNLGDAKFNYTGYWIFFCNPKYWQIDEFLETDEINSTWRVTDWQSAHFQKGQFAVIRVGKDSRTKKELAGKEKLQAGIYGIIEIMSQAQPMLDSDGQFWLNQNKYGEKRLRVKIRYIKKLLDNPILLRDLQNLTDFQNEKALLNGRQASSWSIKKDTFDKILEHAESNIAVVSEVKTTELNDYADLQKFEAKYFNATPRVKAIVNRRIERGDISKAVKKINNYECLVCKTLGLNPHGFKKRNGEFYVETHHIIPVSELQQGSLGTLNLLTVCANHHRQLHYGNVKLIENNDKYFEFTIDNQQIRIDKIKVDKN
ncbi:EVE domain-containing protein [Arenibacter aquaticus]|uniref:EVE domain-containing protein n=1 Tax=Arenibacter aquaticus TaxID=2489054 RepID=A0A3S0AD42_9FLAO|nr:EVE domain-containing protein [Arenibacter aquaticus]RTE52769.1 EVE domain-containing protein [Arenibacter aquaticus]